MPRVEPFNLPDTIISSPTQTNPKMLVQTLIFTCLSAFALAAPSAEADPQFALGLQCERLNIPSGRLPPQCQIYCDQRGRGPWWC